MSPFGVITIIPAAWIGADNYPSLAIAAIKSGSIGILDFEYFDFQNKLSKAHDILMNLLEHENTESKSTDKSGLGIRLSLNEIIEPNTNNNFTTAFQSLIQIMRNSEIFQKHAQRILILSSGTSTYTKELLLKISTYCHQNNLKLFCESISINEAEIAESANVDALIAKGHEAGGKIGEETIFVLLQKFRNKIKLPFWAQGGLGEYTASAAYLAGSKGIVLDNQLLLLRESPLSTEQKDRISSFDGSETEIIKFSNIENASSKADLLDKANQVNQTEELVQFRIYVRPGFEYKENLDLTSLRSALIDANNLFSSQSLLPPIFSLGQDICLAKTFTKKYVCLSALIAGIRKQVEQSIKETSNNKIFTENSDLANSHRTKYPILQGAMTRVSDTADFAKAVAKEGALPFLALALMRGNEIDNLLNKTKVQLGSKSWGVGLLGFIPQELRQEQLQVILKHKPPFALIAGGRPDQAKELEKEGIITYLHVPSVSLLSSFIEMGAKHFIFEGKECGGHVGPRSSFILWESMIETILTYIAKGESAKNFHIIFAGGIHDELSAAMLAILAKPLSSLGVKLGLLMGTAYLFTKEAVETGAIVPKFQEAALACNKTILLESGPGHAIRCIDSPYRKVFENKSKELKAKGLSNNELKQELEFMNLGRLRIASKGLNRISTNLKQANLENKQIKFAEFNNIQQDSELQTLSSEQQWTDGMYMIGQVACLRNKVVTIKELHESVCLKSSNLLDELTHATENTKSHSISYKERSAEDKIAIVGISCLFPKANDLDSYWNNILSKVDCIEEIPKEQWDWQKLYSQDPLERDKISSRWGGFLQDIPFDPSTYGIPPASLASIDPIQLLTLEVTRAALADAGYSNKYFPKARTSIILANAGHGPITAFYSLRSMLDWTLQDMDPEYRKKVEERLPEWTEDSFPGYLGNVVAGRVANRFDLNGTNFSVDAACASSLAALYIGIQELRAGKSDMVLLAATDAHNQPGDYLSFSKTHALSPRGKCRTFDASADGIVISEGMAVLVLKRLSQAEKDGDRIYAVIAGIGSSSDGRDLSLTAPRPQGQILALTRAYEDAGIPPSSIGLIEAHGTGTVAGDRAEIEALKQVFVSESTEKKSCAIGSVKTMIGHTKCAAGLASVIKIAKSLYHKVLPPSIGVDEPNPTCKFEESSFYINSETRPWMHNKLTTKAVRRAGVSAFGFGGTNFHTVLEEYEGQKWAEQDSAIKFYPSELFAFRANNRLQLEKQLTNLISLTNKTLELAKQVKGPSPTNEIDSLAKLAFKHHLQQSQITAVNSNTNLNHDSKQLSLAIIANNLDDLLKKLSEAKEIICNESNTSYRSPQHIYFAESFSKPKEIAFLFPGQGSQSINMLKDLSLAFPEIRQSFEKADIVLNNKFSKKLSYYVYPEPVFKDEELSKQISILTNTHIAQPAIAAANMACYKLLQAFNLQANMLAGHSFGEYIALAVSGCFNETELYKIAEERGRILDQTNKQESGNMLAVYASKEQLSKIIESVSDITIANINSPSQCILSGKQSQITETIELLKKQSIKYKPISVSAAFHSPLMQPAQNEFSKALLSLDMHSPKIPVYSNTLANIYPNKPTEVVSLLSEHLIKPVEFQKQIEQMYDSGAHIFIECGPGSVLKSLVSDILKHKEHHVFSLTNSSKHGITQLQITLAQLHTLGIYVDFGKFYKHRFNYSDSMFSQNDGNKNKKPKLMYLINGAHIKKFDGKNISPASRPAQHSIQMLSNELSTPSIMSKQNSVSKHNISKTVTPNPGIFENMSGSPKEKNPNSLISSMTSENLNNGQTNKENRLLAAGSREQVLIEFQRNMLTLTNNFIASQERVMLAYLQGKSPNNSNGNSVLQAQSSQTVLKQTVDNEIQDFLLKTGTSAAETTAERITNNQEFKKETHLIEEPIINRKILNNTEQENENCNGQIDKTKSSKPDTELLISQLIEIVSERTGYPAEMLDPSLDLEADLGIDSIKRVEILNKFRKLLPESVQANLESGLEKLANTKTLQGIINWIRNDLFTEPQMSESEKAIEHTSNQVTDKPTSETKAELNVSTDNESQTHIVRAIPVLRNTHIDTNLFNNYQSQKLTGLYILTEKEQALSKLLARELNLVGAKILILSQKNNSKFNSSQLNINQEINHLDIDLTNAIELENLFILLKQEYKDVSGLLHLIPLADEFKQASNSEKNDNYLPIRSLFSVLHHLTKLNLIEEHKFNLISTTNLGGKFGLENSTIKNPILAAIPGLTKTFAKEYSNAKVNCLDFQENFSDNSKIQVILYEIFKKKDNDIEIAYDENTRFRVEVEKDTLNKIEIKNSDQHSSIKLPQKPLILVTGGARGITANLCHCLAEKYNARFVIIGRGEYQEQEACEYTNIEGLKELKQAIINNLKKENKAVTIAEVETIYQQLIREREIRQNIQKLISNKVEVQYHSFDVRDTKKLTALIDNLYQNYGKIDMVIHGAGIIEDAYIKDKKLDSFDRVFSTKVDAALTLLSKLELNSLSYFIMLSSVVARTGNAGQSDYVSANEVLNKIATSANNNMTGRAISMLWGPWRGGMASEELESIFSQYGWAMIETAQGQNSFLDELSCGQKDKPEILLVSQLSKGETSNNSTKVSLRGSRLSKAKIIEKSENELAVQLDIDPEKDIYLKDHAFDGIPVLPMAVAVELIAEMSTNLEPELQIESIDNLEIPAGIMFETGNKALFITAKYLAKTAINTKLEITISTKKDSLRKNFKAEVNLSSQEQEKQLSTELAFPLEFLKPNYTNQLSKPPSMQKVYGTWLFHGPLFQGINNIDAIGQEGITGSIREIPIGNCLTEEPKEKWTIDPIMLDSAMQLAGVWARNYLDITALPTGFKSLKIYSNTKHTNSKEMKVIIKITEGLSISTEKLKDQELKCDLCIYDKASGMPLMSMERLGGIGSKSLNRLGIQPKEIRLFS